MTTVLCLIDLQTGFAASTSKPLTRNVLREIEKAKAAGQYIIVVEFDGNGPTRTVFKSALRKYPHKHTVMKRGCNGAEEVADYLQSVEIYPTAVKICGVNTDQCVAATANSLAECNPNVQIQIILDACNTNSHFVEVFDFHPTHKFGAYENLVIVDHVEAQVVLAV